MTSKSSFLVSMKENNKRRLWVWVISALGFVLIFPVFTALMINRIVSNTKWISESYGSALAQQILHERLLEGMQEILGFSVLILALTTVIAVISAVQGFSYLYSRKKIDFYMGMPVKRKKRFLVIWLDGILIYIVPYLIGLLISILIAAGNGAVDKTVLYTAVTAFGVNICFYLGVYHMAMLAVMLTGNIVITGFGFMVFCLYELAVRVMVQEYQQLFFKYFNYYGTSCIPVLSPFGMYFKLADGFSYANTPEVKYLLGLLSFAVALVVLSYVCYLKRPAEAAGKAMAFEMTKPVIKILLIVPVTLLAGLIIADAVNFVPQQSMEGIGWMIFAMALVAVIGSALVQVIYEFDIKGMLHKKSHIIISGILAALIFTAFRYDLLGYDDYIPKQDKIESAAFVPEYYEEGDGSAYFDDNGRYISRQTYAGKYMQLTNIEEICELADISMKEYNKVDRYNYTDYEEELGMWSYTTIIYRMKSGREVSRSLWVNVEDQRTTQILDNIFGSEEFKKGYMIGDSDNVLQMLDNEGKYKVAASYGNQVYNEKMTRAEARELLDIYRKDLASADFTNVKESVPVGMIMLEISEEIPGNAYVTTQGLARGSRSYHVSMNIYPFYRESISYLKEHGFYMEDQLKLEDVAKIQVINNNSDIARQLEEKQMLAEDSAAIGTAGGEYTAEQLLELGAADTALAVYGYDGDFDTRVYADYTDKDKLKEIADCIYPENMVISDWDRGKGADYDYQVVVYFKTDSEMTRDYGTNAYYVFLEGEVPDFVEQDTAYRE